MWSIGLWMSARANSGKHYATPTMPTYIGQVLPPMSDCGRFIRDDAGPSAHAIKRSVGSKLHTRECQVLQAYTR